MYRMRDTGDLVSRDQFVARFPQTSFPRVITPQILDDFGADPVFEGPQPMGEPWQYATPGPVESIDGHWVQTYVLEPQFDTEKAKDAFAASWLAMRKDERLAALAERRWRAEIGGATVGEDMRVATDRDSQFALKREYDEAKANPKLLIANWKLAPGSFIAISAPEIIALAEAVRAHVQACFDNEAKLSAAILAASTFAELSAVNIESGWPS